MSYVVKALLLGANRAAISTFSCSRTVNFVRQLISLNYNGKHYNYDKSPLVVTVSQLVLIIVIGHIFYFYVVAPYHQGKKKN